jgi:hypothetical protein
MCDPQICPILVKALDINLKASKRFQSFGYKCKRVGTKFKTEREWKISRAYKEISREKSRRLCKNQ